MKRSELAEMALPTGQRTARRSGWPWDGADQGGAVVPDNGVATHEILRPVTHWLVKTEVSRLIRG